MNLTELKRLKIIFYYTKKYHLIFYFVTQRMVHKKKVKKK